MTVLRLPARLVDELRTELLQSDGQERFAFLYAGQQGDLLGSAAVPVADEQMARQSETACRPDPATEREHVGACYERDLVLILSHSHPFSERAQFSSIDVESMDRFREWIAGLFPDRRFGFAVLGTHGVSAVGGDGEKLESLSIEVLGEWKLDRPVPEATCRFAVSPGTDGDERSDDAPRVNRSIHQGRFDRGIRALGTGGQCRLESATVGIVGAGGLGSLVAEQLARLGVGTLVLVDDDVVEESNLSRLAGAYDHHVGKPKVEVLKEHLWKCGADVSVAAVEERIQHCPEALDPCDLVIGCVDEVTTRTFCNEYAVKHLTYYVDAGVRIDVTDEQTVERTGYVHLVAPGSNGCIDCLGRHDQEAARIEQLSPAERAAVQERGYVEDEALTPEPALIHLNGLCASKTVSVVVDLVTGGDAPPDFLRIEDHANDIAELTTEPSLACPTCGEDGVLGVGRRQFGDAQFSPEGGQIETD